MKITQQAADAKAGMTARRGSPNKPVSATSAPRQ